MKRWAELLIRKVDKDNKGRIQKVKVGIDVISDSVGLVELTKEQVITILKDKAIIKTVYEDDKGVLQEGAIVGYYIENNGEEYLKTNVNRTAKDNLDNLPPF